MSGASIHPPESVGTLVDLLKLRVSEDPDRRMYTFLEDGEREGAVWTRADLDRKARAVAAELQALGLVKGDAALLVYPQGLDFVSALVGCMYAGVLGVPAPSPDPSRLARTAPRLAQIARNAGAKVVLVHSGLYELHEYLPSELPDIAWLVTDGISDDKAQAYVEVTSTADDVAYLQYTSGSTSAPKGVMVKYRNLLAHAWGVQEWHAHPPEGTMVSWLPLFHDYGLVYGLFHALYVGCDAVLLSPQAFVQRPMRWLEAISKYRGTFSPTPNFALDLCVSKSTPAERAKLDLSCWTLLNGSEPIHEDTERRFGEAFAVANFQTKQMVHAYGMAESTLIISVEPYDRDGRFLHIDGDAYERNEVVLVDEQAPGMQSVASCGPPLPGTTVRIVDPQTSKALADGRVGEVWVAGGIVCHGYWKNEEATEETFRARIVGSDEGPFLRTGDLGFIHDGRLYISGRHKDLIIVHGANKHPQDIEWQIQALHPAFRPSCGAAFGLYVEGEERLGFVSEVKPELVDDLQKVYAAVFEVAGLNGLTVAKIALIQPRSLPKTSSGKVQRRLTRDLLKQGKLPLVAEWTMEPPPPGSDASDLRERIAERPKRARALVVERLRGKAGSLVGLPADQVSADRALREQGLDSVAAVELVEWLERATGTELGVATVFECANIDELADLVLLRLR
ncbi:MAG: AMP-binding protein [Alphaproteobacteria bacterium]|nr:AMP-binding protein [Alphaproteobacteria bacterium]